VAAGDRGVVEADVREARAPDPGPSRLDVDHLDLAVRALEGEAGGRGVKALAHLGDPLGCLLGAHHGVRIRRGTPEQGGAAEAGAAAGGALGERVQ
jgi:hypothetical protein